MHVTPKDLACSNRSAWQVQKKSIATADIKDFIYFNFILFIYYYFYFIFYFIFIFYFFLGGRGAGFLKYPVLLISKLENELTVSYAGFAG